MRADLRKLKYDIYSRPMGYLLRGKKPVPIDLDSEFDRRLFSLGLRDAKSRTVALTRLGRNNLSTVFIMADHSFTFQGPPLVFETAMFTSTGVEILARYSTWWNAKRTHRAIVRAWYAKHRKVRTKSHRRWRKC